MVIQVKVYIVIIAKGTDVRNAISTDMNVLVKKNVTGVGNQVVGVIAVMLAKPIIVTIVVVHVKKAGAIGRADDFRI